MRRLSHGGFKKEFVRPAILPEWWDKTCNEDPSLLPELELRVARFLGLPLSAIRDPAVVLTAPAYPEARLRRVRDLDRDRLGPAIHSAIRIAEAVVRCLRNTAEANVPPPDGLAWRQQIRRARPAVSLDDILADLWRRGIPVVPVEMMPSPSFQGVACVVGGRPVIVLGHRYDEPGRVAFVVAHEVGHIALGDSKAGQPVVDEDGEVPDDAEMERKADTYALRVVVGGDTIPLLRATDFKHLAVGARRLEDTSGADATALILHWARREADYGTATLALKALYRASGARRMLRRHFDYNVDLDAAAESDRAVLRCVFGDPERHAPLD